MATGPDLSSPAAAAAAAAEAPSSSSSAAAKKDRHIVSWSAEEDDVLRTQIAIHGTDNWTIIAAQFKDKTARQCRRRWYNYLNSECKKGGWSREEDLLLCEAQKVLGNKWTEIAKVVSGRTDNAVKNRFSTLCKRRAKDDELFKENGSLCSSANAKRTLAQTECLTSGAAGSAPPIKQMRPCNSDFKENMEPNMRLGVQDKNAQQDSRQPLAIVCQSNQDNVNTMDTQNLVAKTSSKQLFGGEQNCVKREGNFLNKDDPKIATLLQRADLLCSLATKINTEKMSQSMDEAWQQLQHHLDKKDDNGMSESSMSGMASLLEDLDDLIVDPYENEEEDDQNLREQTEQIDVQNKQNSSQTSMEVTSQMAPNNIMEDCPNDKSVEDNNMEPCPGADMPTSENLTEAAIEDSLLQCMEYNSPVHIVIQAKTNAEIAASENLSEVLKHGRLQCIKLASPAHVTTQAEADAETPSSEKLSEVVKCNKPPCMEFTSPAHTVPTFLPYADDMPTPKFTASERNFLLSVLELTSPGSRPDTSQQPSCKRALLNSL
ncbi:hypothetical protein E2562_013246 [Oryza meyeriana var. granulata]|uniref:Uncharacterized protein n=1 Tax=Oryza meyeriana var. granulata TaxID=110450 RepID=A0A6G1D371_9ORYZ|nr:hypothetical protein E2562_013246 [Oryza meyeriana var. granulata]